MKRNKNKSIPKQCPKCGGFDFHGNGCPLVGKK